MRDQDTMGQPGNGADSEENRKTGESTEGGGTFAEVFSAAVERQEPSAYEPALDTEEGAQGAAGEAQGAALEAQGAAGEAQGAALEAQEAAGADAPEGGETPPPFKNPIHRLYDKIPLTYRQVDILVKVLIGVFVLVLAWAIVAGMR